MLSLYSYAKIFMIINDYILTLFLNFYEYMRKTLSEFNHIIKIMSMNITVFVI